MTNIRLKSFDSIFHKLQMKQIFKNEERTDMMINQIDKVIKKTEAGNAYELTC